MLRSTFSDLFGLTAPLMNAPMAGAAGGTLAAAVANAGALGMIGGSVSSAAVGTGDSPEVSLRREIQVARSLTSKPFGIGFISTQRLPDGQRSVEALQSAALDEGMQIIMHSFIVDAKLIAEAIRRGARVICQVQTLAMAREALDAGASALVAQGNDGGGHVGAIGSMSIVPAVVDVAESVPVIAAGGIADGRGLAAAFMLGAQGANIGTRFYASGEADVLPYIHERLVSATTDDTVWTRSFDIVRNADFGPTVAGRVVKNAFTDAWHTRESEARANAPQLAQQLQTAREAGDPTVASVWSSSAVGLIRDVEPAGAIVRDICAEAERIMRSRVASLLL